MGSYPGLSSDVSGGNTPPPQPQVCGELRVESCWRVGGWVVLGRWKGGHPNHSFFSFHVSFFYLRLNQIPLKMELRQFWKGYYVFFCDLEGPVDSHTSGWSTNRPSRTSCRDSNLVEAPVRSVRVRQFWRGWGPVGKGSMVE